MWNGKINIYNFDEYYYNFYLTFEGEYLNGLKNGKGKEFNYEGKLIFEGEYLNGLKKGKGKNYNKEGQLIFEEKYKNGIEWNGKGKKIISIWCR